MLRLKELWGMLEEGKEYKDSEIDTLIKYNVSDRYLQERLANKRMKAATALQKVKAWSWTIQSSKVTLRC